MSSIIAERVFGPGTWGLGIGRLGERRTPPPLAHLDFGNVCRGRRQFPVRPRFGEGAGIEVSDQQRGLSHLLARCRRNRQAMHFVDDSRQQTSLAGPQLQFLDGHFRNRFNT